MSQRKKKSQKLAIDKQVFCEILLSRFMALDGAGKWHFFRCLQAGEFDVYVAAEKDGAERFEDTETFVECARMVLEALFPEELGDIIESSSIVERWKEKLKKGERDDERTTQ